MKETLDIITTVATVFLLCATIFIAYDVHKQAIALKKIEIQSRAIESYNILNRIALSSDQNLIAFDILGGDNVNDPIELRRKRWAAFVWLEALQVTFVGLEKGMIDRKYADQALDQQLKVILKDQFVVDLVSERGFDPDFVIHCKKIKEDIDRVNKGKTES